MFISLNISFLHSLPASLGALLPTNHPSPHPSFPLAGCVQGKKGTLTACLPVLTSPGLDMEASPHHLQTKAYVRQFQVIDNQNLLFELSYKLEANSQ